MSIEDNLKKLILDRYGSIREFTLKINMPYSTFNSIIERGVNNANVDNIIKICRELHISVDALGNGEIKPTYLVEAVPKNVEDIIADTRRRLTAYSLMLKGKLATPETIDAILDSLDAGVYIAEKKNNE